MTVQTLPRFLLDSGICTGLAAIVMWGAIVRPAVSGPLDQTADVHVSHIRPLDAKAAALVREGPARSATINTLLATLDESDLLIFVETGYLIVPSQLTFTGTSSSHRLVRITLNVPEACDRLLCWLAHELQHAAEIAAAPEVISAATLRCYYFRHGLIGSGAGQCTAAAQKVTALVLAEVGASRRPDSE